MIDPSTPVTNEGPTSHGKPVGSGPSGAEPEALGTSKDIRVTGSWSSISKAGKRRASSLIGSVNSRVKRMIEDGICLPFVMFTAAFPEFHYLQFIASQYKFSYIFEFVPPARYKVDISPCLQVIILQ